MCGITGFWDLSGQLSDEKMQLVVKQMSDRLLHRGPDDGGGWVDVRARIALGHRRLSILDLSAQGHQPMHSKSDRYTIVFNGEIYNFLELRQNLASLGHKFRGNSDTEVMLASFSQWGVVSAVDRLTGMFAFGLWDKQEQVLYLGRDRLGEKPLYYGWVGDTFLFGSELKALKAYPEWHGEIDRKAIALLMRHSYIPEPYSIYQNIYKLPPGTLLTVDGGNKSLIPVPYWSVKSVVKAGTARPFSGSETEAINQLDSLLHDVVGDQMVADVPLGAFLSGGIDSSCIVALMQVQSNRQVKTFSIGFNEDAYNEAQYAKAVAQHLGTEHTELYVTAKEAINVIPKLPTLYDEPFADPSQIPTFLVAQLARQQVTVSLSGDGADELFGGYDRYFRGRSIWQKIGWMPQSWRKAISQCLNILSPQTLYQSSNKLQKLAQALAAEHPEAIYRELVSHWKQPELLVIGASEPITALNNPQLWVDLPDFTSRMMYLDSVTYLPSDILTKVDRATMGMSLEVRVPFLDRRVVEFAWQIPPSMKIRNNQGKWLLHQVLYKYVPPSLVERPKMGFGVPIEDWLRGSLRDWAESLLNESRLQQEGFFQPQPIRQKWLEHLSGKQNWQYYLWDVLMFQSWLEQEKNL